MAGPSPFLKRKVMEQIYAIVISVDKWNDEAVMPIIMALIGLGKAEAFMPRVILLRTSSKMPVKHIAKTIEEAVSDESMTVGIFPIKDDDEELQYLISCN